MLKLTCQVFSTQGPLKKEITQLVSLLLKSTYVFVYDVKYIN